MNPPGVMDVRAFGSWTSAPKFLFFQDFEGLTVVFACSLTSAGISPWTSAGYPQRASKLTLFDCEFVLDLCPVRVRGCANSVKNVWSSAEKTRIAFEAGYPYALKMLHLFRTASNRAACCNGTFDPYAERGCAKFASRRGLPSSLKKPGCFEACSRHSFECGIFSYSWKLPAYSGAFLLTVDSFSVVYLQLELFLLTVLASLLTVGALLLTVGKRV